MLAQALTGLRQFNQEATAENWQSELLQMAFYVLLTSFLYQKGPSESKGP